MLTSHGFVLQPLPCASCTEYKLKEEMGFSFGFALLPVNGFITALGLGLISIPRLRLKSE